MVKHIMIHGTQATIGLLLHEMVHAMLEVFSCRCNCRASTSGLTGHGPFFLKLAQTMEYEMNRPWREKEVSLMLCANLRSKVFLLYNTTVAFKPEI